ncbi:hypothetical protein [Flagellimonas marina]|uniref:Lipoprotein n=1 Tax=Flagellimonas marina TaxID=1775168 RepID=A0ABV8PPN1_9FLAO
MHRNKTVWVLGLFLALLSCKNSKKEPQEAPKTEIDKPLALSGHYVTDGYEKRNEGYDWVGVMVSELDPDNLEIKVRSRADQKRPTCTFDATVTKVNDSTYQTQIESKPVLFQFSDNSLAISAKNQEDSGLLNFYCSGGASFAGTYEKINAPPMKVKLTPRSSAKC